MNLSESVADGRFSHAFLGGDVHVGTTLQFFLYEITLLWEQLVPDLFECGAVFGSDKRLDKGFFGVSTGISEIVIAVVRIVAITVSVGLVVDRSVIVFTALGVEFGVV